MAQNALFLLQSAKGLQCFSKTKLLWLAALALGLATLSHFTGGQMGTLLGHQVGQSRELLKVKALIFPTSTDPLLYDNFVHHLAFTSVLSGLVNQYKKGEIKPQVAERWTVSDDGLAYRFWIKRGLTFSDGSEITGDVVAANLRRVAYVKQERGSRSGLLEFVEGFGTIRSADDRTFSGIEVSRSEDGGQDIVTIHLSRPVSDFLEKLSFGFYTIAHPSSFDPKTGSWRDAKNPISSGPYKIAKWTDNHLVLELRIDTNFDIHPRAYRKIEISNTRDPETAFSADVYMGSQDSLAAPAGHVFHGPVASNITYIRCDLSDDPTNPLSNRLIRLAFRTLLYAEAEKRGLPIARSFFPPALQRVEELSDPSVASPAEVQAIMQAWRGKTRDLVLPLFPTPMKSPDKKHIKHSFETLFEATEAALKSLGIPYRVRPYSLAGEETFKYDIMYWITGVRVDAPLADIRFMFLSKEGIQLPDETGEIKKLVASETFEPQRVNELLWEQGLIWPLDHTTQGLWVAPTVDMSMVATHLPPTAFEFIGAKD